MVVWTGMRMVVFRKMSGHGAGCWICCSVLTDDPGLVLNEGEVDTAPTQPAFQGRELIVQVMGRTVRVANIVHPCRVNLFEKPCPRLWTNLGSEGKIIE